MPETLLQDLLPEGQDWLRNRMRKLGYTSNMPGICFGVSHMVMQAILAGKLDELLNRLTLIAEIPEELFAKESWKTGLSSAQVTDILAFFDSLELYHNAYLYPDLFEEKNRPDSQNALLTFPLVSPIALEGKKLVNPINFSGVYDEKELAIHLEEIQKALKDNDFQDPIALVLGDINHSITAEYNPRDNAWRLFDPNQLNSLNPIDNSALAKRIFNAFSEKKQYVIFNTNIYERQPDEHSIKNCFLQLSAQENWQKIHAITDEKIKFISSKESSWLWMAALKQPEILASLLEAIAQLDLSVQTTLLTNCNTGGWNALMLAARYHPESVVPLLEAIAKLEPSAQTAILTQKTNDEWHALMLAARHHPKIIEPLLESITKLDASVQTTLFTQQNKEGWNTLMLAAFEHPEIVAPLLKTIEKLEPSAQAALFIQKNKIEWNALMLAARYHPKIVVSLLESITTLDASAQVELFTQKDKNEWNALMLATRYHPESVVSLLKAIAKLEASAQEALFTQSIKDSGANILTLGAEKHPEIIVPLLESIAKLDTSTQAALFTHCTKRYKWNALMFAAFGHPEIIAPLLEAIAKLNPTAQAVIFTQKGNNNENALMLAARNGSTLAVKKLAEKIDPCAETPDGITALFLAAQNGHTEVVRYLLSLSKETVKYHIAFNTNTTSLLKFAQSYTPEIQQRMKTWIDQREGNVAIQPKEIAFIMGHNTIALLLDNPPLISKNYKFFHSKDKDTSALRHETESIKKGETNP